ncbi:MAG: hypothetical protein KatS3mg009_0340 [Acidimicrobiia bacterium]|nr:MAG: hypothetical protein KatS3mg009_0340 [Acidimicrobiia bacterium]
MASQLRFEGAVLEDVLEQVRRDVGRGARIVAAHRVRKGGIAGFFAREHFEVIVEAPGPEVEEEAARPAAPAAGRDRRAGTGRVRVPASILDLAEAVNETERAAPDIDLVDGPRPAIEPRPSTESAAFADVLERIAAVADGGDDPGGRGGTGGDSRGTGGDDRGTATRTVHIDDDRAHRADDRGTAARTVHIDDDRAHRADEPDARPAAAGTGRARRAGREDAPDGDGRAGRRGRAAAAPGRGSRPVAVATGVLDHPGPAAETDEIVVEPPATPGRRAPRRADEVIERPENALVRLGVPARLVPRGVGMRELQGALVETMSRLPAPPPLPDAPGVVVAVVGAGAEPVLLARELAAEIGTDPDCVVLAVPQQLGGGVPAWLQVCDAATAEERRRSWRRRAHPTVVACSLPAATGRGALGWAREILDHLEPTCTWAIVDAGWKCEDVQHWADALGGIDVMALTNLEETVSPAAVLDLGIPVGRLDDRVATPVAWAELLLERMR